MYVYLCFKTPNSIMFIFYAISTANSLICIMDISTTNSLLSDFKYIFFFLILSHTIHIPIILVILLIKPVYRKYLARAILVCISRVNLEEHGAKVDTVR